MRYGENALIVIDGVKKKLDEVRSSFPPGVRVIPTYDRSTLILKAIDTLREKASRAEAIRQDQRRGLLQRIQHSGSRHRSAWVSRTP